MRKSNRGVGGGGRVVASSSSSNSKEMHVVQLLPAVAQHTCKNHRRDLHGKELLHEVKMASGSCHRYCVAA